MQNAGSVGWDGGDGNGILGERWEWNIG